MATLERLSRRMETLRSIRNVVRTMKTMSAVNAAPYERAATAIDRYHATVLRGLQAALHRIEPPRPAAARDGMPRAVLVFGSDHGLCGGYNETVAAVAQAEIARGDCRVLAVGARMEDALSGLGARPARAFMPPASTSGVGRLAGELLIALDALRGPGGDIAVVTVHMRRAAGRGQAPHVHQLLPAPPAFFADLRQRPWRSRALPQFTMAPEALFAALIRNHLFASVFRAAAEAMAAENAARLALMQQAERSIDERIAELTAATRAERQSEITSELLDVIAGFEALSRAPRKAPEDPAPAPG